MEIAQCVVYGMTNEYLTDLIVSTTIQYKYTLSLFLKASHFAYG
jgi:uncharacterized membrane protein YeiB